MNAARILSRGGYDTEELRRELSPIRLEEVNVWPAGRAVRLLWRSDVRGVTLWRVVLADPGVFREESGRLARFVIHELVHVRQFAEIGYLRFLYRYLRDYLSGRLCGQDHRSAYLAIPAEREAREVADRYV